jgi:hypothetical protein
VKANRRRRVRRSHEPRSARRCAAFAAPRTAREL